MKMCQTVILSWIFYYNEKRVKRPAVTQLLFFWVCPYMCKVQAQDEPESAAAQQSYITFLS